MNLAQMRALLRKDLHDEDSANYRWTDGELDRHVQRAVRDFSLASPLEAKTTLAATPGSREISISALTDIVAIEAVEYPAGAYPPSYVRHSVWLNTLTLLVDAAPASAENVVIYYTQRHAIDVSSSTVPARFEDVIACGAAGYAAVEWVIRDEPRQRGRPGCVAGLPHVGTGPPRRVSARTRPARPAQRRLGPASLRAGVNAGVKRP